MLSPFLTIELLLLGAASGFLAGLLGLGGGILLVPFLTLIFSTHNVPPEIAIKMSIATSMATIVFTALSSLLAHQRHQAIRWNWVTALTPGIIFGSLTASLGVFSELKGTALAVLFALFVSLAATHIISGRQPLPTQHKSNLLATNLAGAVIGFCCGLVGIGGGSMSVPFMLWHNLSMHNAVATSAALGFPIAFFNVMGYLLNQVMHPEALQTLPTATYGYIHGFSLMCLVPTSMLMAPVGARMAHALPTARLKRVFAIMLYLLALYMLTKAF